MAQKRFCRTDAKWELSWSLRYIHVRMQFTETYMYTYACMCTVRLCIYTYMLFRGTFTLTLLVFFPSTCHVLEYKHSMILSQSQRSRVTNGSKSLSFEVPFSCEINQSAVTVIQRNWECYTTYMYMEQYRQRS